MSLPPDMPQPYRNTSEVKIRWSPLSQRPRIASLIAQAIGSYAMAEAMLANILGKVLHINEHLALDIYLSLRGDGPSRDIFEWPAAPMPAQVYTEKELEAYAKRVSDLAENVFRFGRGL